MADLEAVGGAVTGGLIASAVEKPTGRAGEHHPVCADCGAQTIGRFCHDCGNASHVHRTLSHLGEELLHGVMHFDSRAWRTLPRLVFRPGQLTREWCEGKRARYVSPLAMFLFTVFVIFMLLSYLPAAPEQMTVRREAVSAAELARKRAEVVEARRNLDEASPAERAAAELVLRAAEAELERATRPGSGAGASQADAPPERFDFSTGNAQLDQKIAEKLQNPELALYKLQQTFYKFSFLLVPISIPFVALLFLWKPGFTLYDHGVFVLYSLTFMSTLLLVVALAIRQGGAVAGLATAAVPFVAPAHMFFQLKGAYGLGVLGALWRTVLLLAFSSVALALFVLAIIGLGMI